MAQAAISAMVVKKQGRPFYSPVKTQDLLDLAELMDVGKLRPVIDKTYPLSETAAAMAYVATGHASGKTVIKI
jgi:NADPH:quinone reductase-like Zn-dependent oxidoreductase